MSDIALYSRTPHGVRFVCYLNAEDNTASGGRYPVIVERLDMSDQEYIEKLEQMIDECVALRDVMLMGTSDAEEILNRARANVEARRAKASMSAPPPPTLSTEDEK